MPRRAYHYQYETSPRKLKPEYEPVRRKKPRQVKRTKPVQHTSVQKKTKQQRKTKSKVFLFLKCMFMFAILFIIIFRNSQMSESFSQIQKLKADITSLQKETDQLKVSIQNSLNTNNIEQSAKDLLGMQKLTNKQTIYIQLPKEDYVEPQTETVIIEEEPSLWDKIIEYITHAF